MNRVIVLFLLTLVFEGFSQTIDMGLFKGMTLRNIGPAGMSGRITAIDVVLKNLNVMYVGSGSGGLWKSENGGHTWQPIFEHEKRLPSGQLPFIKITPARFTSARVKAIPATATTAATVCIKFGRRPDLATSRFREHTPDSPRHYSSHQS